MFSQTIAALERFDNQHDFERMCADILNAQGYRDVIPIAPRGGSDAGKDITFISEHGEKGLACVTLRKDIDKKFKEDFAKRKAGEFDKYILFCTAYLTHQQKVQFAKHCIDKLQAEFVPYDIEALRSLLDSSLALSPIREKYLSMMRSDMTAHNDVLDNQREAMLSSYFDSMSELLLKEGLRESKPSDAVRNIARVRTLSVLPKLDAERKERVFQLLYESGLIGIISLSDADLSEADLSGANLNEAKLRKCNLSKANLNWTTLIKADLIYANLRDATLVGATLWGADLRNCDLSGANLENSALSGVTLSGATYTEEQLSKARWNDNITR